MAKKPKKKKTYIKVESVRYRRMLRDRERLLKLKSFAGLMNQILVKIK